MGDIQQSVSDYFSRFLHAEGGSPPTVVQLPLSVYLNKKHQEMIQWCQTHIEYAFDFAVLGAIEDEDNCWKLHVTAAAVPSGLFFAFVDPDDAMMFYLTWRGES